jgi:hypothetical protein
VYVGITDDVGGSSVLAVGWGIKRKGKLKTEKIRLPNSDAFLTLSLSDFTLWVLLSLVELGCLGRLWVWIMKEENFVDAKSHAWRCTSHGQ